MGKTSRRFTKREIPRSEPIKEDKYRSEDKYKGMSSLDFEDDDELEYDESREDWLDYLNDQEE